MKEYSDEELIEAAQRCANTYARIANRELGCNLPIPFPVDFDLCDRDPKAAGQAWSTMKIEINLVLYRENVRETLNETLPHEMAHIVQYDKFNNKGAKTQGHGAEWQEIMRKFGKEPLKHHTMDLSNAIKHYKELKARKKKEQALKERDSESS